MVAAMAGACTEPDPNPKEAARCEALAQYLDRYTHYTPFGTGPSLRKSIACEQCRRGHEEDGIGMLEDLYRRHRLDIPAPLARRPPAVLAQPAHASAAPGPSGL